GLGELAPWILGHDEHRAVDRSRGRALGQPTGTVTFAFCDVEAPPRLWARGPDAPAALARHDELVRAAVDRHGGYVFAAGGDSSGAAFPRAPAAAAWAAALP